jgi:hypothetical protein
VIWFAACPLLWLSGHACPLGSVYRFKMTLSSHRISDSGENMPDYRDFGGALQVTTDAPR